MERFRSLVVLVSFYCLWSALLKDRPSFAGYNWTQMVTYVLGMDLLRSFVFASRTWEISREINHGRLSAYLLKPVNFFFYTFSRDLSEKSTNIVSAVIEISLLSLIFHMKIQWPQSGWTWILFIVSVINATAMYFVLNFMVGCWGFWTAESGGPRFLLELFLEFSAGAFFPLDVLPRSLQQALAALPSPYLVFFPLRLFLEKLSPREIVSGFAAQMFWIGALALVARLIWLKGIRFYGAEGS